MCTNLITIRRKQAGKVITCLVPCGKCSECVKRNQNGFVVRCLSESLKSSNICFFTLTYSDDNLPYNEAGEPTLKREDVKLWKKRFRHLIDNKDFSWCCIGEYGSRTHRPHYHGLIFGLSESDCKKIENAWNLGFTVFKQVPAYSQKDKSCVASYVSKYIYKPIDLKVFSDTVELPRLMTSKGFGLGSDFEDLRRYILCFDKYEYDPFDYSTITQEIVNSVIDRLKFTFNGFSYSLPLYILKKVLYEKNVKGNLAPCALRRLVSLTLRSRFAAVSDSAIKDASCFSEKDSSFDLDKVKDFINSQESTLLFRQSSSERSLYKSYKATSF